MEFSYKKNMSEVVHRHGKLWTQNFTDEVLVKVDVDGMNTVDFHIAGVMHHAPDYEKMFGAYRDFYGQRADILDDSIPVARASLGSAAIGHFFGGEVQWTPGGAFSPAFINDLKTFDFSQLDYNPENRWVKTQMEMVDYFIQNAKGLFPVCITEVLIGLQFAEYLLGPELYLALYDHPDLLAKLVDKSLEFTIRLIDEQRKYIQKYQDGIFEMFEVWLPGNQIWNSVDAYGNCNPKIYQKLGKPFYEEIGRYYGGMWMHMHSGHLHLLREIANTQYVSGISIWDDPTAPRGFDKIDEIIQDANGIPLHIFCTKDELLDGIKNKTLRRNVYYWCISGVKSVDEANQIVERVYEY